MKKRIQGTGERCSSKKAYFVFRHVFRQIHICFEKGAWLRCTISVAFNFTDSSCVNATFGNFQLFRPAAATKSVLINHELPSNQKHSGTRHLSYLSYQSYICSRTFCRPEIPETSVSQALGLNANKSGTTKQKYAQMSAKEQVLSPSTSSQSFFRLILS